MNTSREEVLRKLNEIFKDYFDDETIVITDETTSNDIEEWDSLEHINLIVTIEDAFDVKFSMGETTKMKNIGEMVDLITEKIK